MHEFQLVISPSQVKEKEVYECEDKSCKLNEEKSYEKSRKVEVEDEEKSMVFKRKSLKDEVKSDVPVKSLGDEEKSIVRSREVLKGEEKFDVPVKSLKDEQKSTVLMRKFLRDEEKSDVPVKSVKDEEKSIVVMRKSLKDKEKLDVPVKNVNEKEKYVFKRRVPDEENPIVLNDSSSKSQVKSKYSSLKSELQLQPSKENSLGYVSDCNVEDLKSCCCGQDLPKAYDNVGLVDKIELFEHINASGSHNFQCCRIPVSSFNIPLWRELLADYEDVAVVDLLQYGFPLDFDRSRNVSQTDIRNHKGARDYPEFIDQYLQKEREAKRIMGPFRKNPFSVPLIVSPLNTVPKSSTDERRTIVDLSWPIGESINDGISKQVYLGDIIDLHYASVEQVCDMVRCVGTGSVIYKRDLRHAYRQIPIDPRDYCYLGYSWGDELFFDTVLLMGQRNAGLACCRTTNAVMFMHGQKGHMGTNYLDDLIGVSSWNDGWVAYESLGQLLSELGLLENFEKACPPSTTQLVLGIVINTVDGTLSVPDERMAEILLLVADWQDKSQCSKVELQSLIGKLQYVTKCVWQSRVFINRLLYTLRSMGERKRVKLNESFQKDLRWWSMFMKDFNGTSFIPSAIWSEPDITFATDSCLTGCGGVCGKQYFHSAFPDEIMCQNLPIHGLEMLAVLVGVRIWGSQCLGNRVQIYCDNESVVKVINSSKTHDPFMATCLRELWLEVSRCHFQLRAVHLPGEENRLPDWLSRWDCGQNYRDLFNNFIRDDDYVEISIPHDLFRFSDNL